MAELLSEKQRRDIEDIFSMMNLIAKTPEQKSFILGFIAGFSNVSKFEKQEAQEAQAS